MKRTALSSLCLALAVSFGLSVAASSDALAQAKGKKGADAAKKVKTYDFSGDDIDGDLVKPDGDFVDTRKFAKHTSLIRIRKDFIKEILKSAEDL